MKRPRVLMVAPECPSPADTGLKNHALGMLRALVRLADVSVLGFEGGEEEIARWRALAERESVALKGLLPRVSGLRRWTGRLDALGRGLPLSCADFDGRDLSPALLGCLDKASAEGRPFDLVAFEMFWTLLAAPRLTGIKTVLFPVDGYRLYWNRMRQMTPDWADAARCRYLEHSFRLVEARHYGRVDRIVTVAPDDAASISSSCPGARVGVLPVPLLREPRAARRPIGRVRVLIGGHFHTPSIAADAGRFLEAIKERKPDAELIVWGRGAQAAGLAGPAAEAGARVVEWVDDVDEFRSHATVYVYPQRFACGIQTKIQEAMAAGLCVLAGPEVLGPVGARPGREAVLSRGPDEAAVALIELLRHPGRAEAIGRRARDFALREFSLDAVSHRLAALLGWPAPEAGQEQEIPNDHLLHC